MGIIKKGIVNYYSTTDLEKALEERVHKLEKINKRLRKQNKQLRLEKRKK